MCPPCCTFHAHRLLSPLHGHACFSTRCTCDAIDHCLSKVKAFHCCLSVRPEASKPQLTLTVARQAEFIAYHSLKDSVFKMLGDNHTAPHCHIPRQLGGGCARLRQGLPDQHWRKSVACALHARTRGVSVIVTVKAPPTAFLGDRSVHHCHDGEHCEQFKARIAVSSAKEVCLNVPV